ncbi:MAG: large-conductance mechanosensitive channel protein MscL [Bacillota bacterium]|nr:large-conductance mechanosensitive channel protein MscL [Bacillota bacterium]
MKKFIAEFRDFAFKGNVLDLAIGVIIGGAFGKIVTSLVNDIIMPIVGLLLGGIDFSKLSFKIGDSVIAYGNFIQNVVDFLIIAFCIFMFVKVIQKFKKLYATTSSASPEPSKEEALLTEIRDILKNNK